jgi:hypothetical protein
MSTNVVQASFAAGELAPAMFGRVDIDKYKIGASMMRNFFVNYNGGASTRPGTQFVGRTLDQSGAPVRLIPFIFSVTNTAVLEFGNFYMRIIQNGAYTLEAAKVISAITNANPGVFTITAHGYSNGQSVNIESGTGITALNGRTFNITGVTTNTFTLLDEFNNPLDTTLLGTYSTNSATAQRVYTINSPYASADLALLKFTQSADVMTFTHASYLPQNLKRTGSTSWAFSGISFGPQIVSPTLTLIAIEGGGTAVVTYYGYAVTAIGPSGEESYPSGIVRLSGNNIETAAGTVRLYWQPVAGAQYYVVYSAGFNFYDAETLSSDRGIANGTQLGFAGTSRGITFTDNFILPDFTTQPPSFRTPFAPGQILSTTISNQGTGYPRFGTVINIADSTGSGAYILPDISFGSIGGLIIIFPGVNYTAPTFTATGTGGSGFAGAGQPAPLTGTYPSTCAYFQQRLMYGATTNSPQTIWGSKPGAIYNMDITVPENDGDAITMTLASTQVNQIKYMLPMPGGLVLFTTGGVWQLSAGAGGSVPVTASTVVATAQSVDGCADLPPIGINYNILFVQNIGTIVRELQYQFFVQIYTTRDISVLSSHLFANYTLKEWAYAVNPFRIIWVVRSDGALLSLTYLKEQEILGWAHHDTYGSYLSITTVTEGNTSAVYVLVSRWINGSLLYFIERFAQRTLPYGIEDAWCVDAGLQYPLLFPNATIFLNGLTGLLTLTALTATFTTNNIGDVLRVAGGIGTVIAFISSTQLSVQMSQPIVLPDGFANPKITPLFTSGQWSLTTPVTVISGLWHLQNMIVSIIADGVVQPAQTVTNGAITLATAASKITIGLGYQCQLQTLFLDIAQSSIEGKRKKFGATTLRLQDSNGLKVGPDLNTLTPIKEPTPATLNTGDERVVLLPYYKTQGQIAIEQDNPLPATVLAVATEIVLGDTP